MTDNPGTQPYPEAFYQLVKQVLENFYDFPYLNRHPLAKSVQLPRLRPSEMDGQRLRRIFSTAIESLKPGSEVEERSIFGRYYRLLQQHYVDSNTMQEVARLLGVSERQAYRDLKRAEESLASALWTQLGASLDNPMEGLLKLEPALETDPDAAGDVHDLHLQMSGVQADLLLKNAQKAVERLAAERNILIEITPPVMPARMYTDPSFAQQMLIRILSSIVQQVNTERITIHTETDEARLRLLFEFEQREGTPYSLPRGPVIDTLLERLAWQVNLEPSSRTGLWTMALTIPLQETILLVIDDNNALIELLRRYLTHTRCQVVGATDGLQGLKLAQSLHPGAILLDIMMPNIDGWEVLQRLRANPETNQIAVIICSIFNDPELARSLGAAYTLGKPVNRTELINLLGRLHLI